MKIGFDISDLCAAQADGTTRYTHQLALKLPSVATEHDWLYFAPCESEMVKDVVVQQKVTPVISPWPKYWTQSRFPFDLLKHRPDLLFMPIQQLPLFRPHKMKTVAVVHDLASHIYPEQFGYKDWALQHLFTARAVRDADAVIAVSESTKSDIEKYYGRSDNVHVVYHGIDTKQFRLPSDAEREASWNTVRQKYPSLTKPFLLFVGQIQPRKNITGLVDAFEKLKKKDKDLQLVIAGGHGWLQQPIIDRIESSPEKSSIHRLGRVPDELLASLYWHAEVFVLPSFYEGFGIPVIEAMACGVPVVTSDNSSLGEVSGSAARLFDPNKTDELVDAIVDARARRDHFAKLGIERAAQFTWDNTTAATWDVLKSVL